MKCLTVLCELKVSRLRCVEETLEAVGSRDAFPPLRGCQAVAAETFTPVTVLCKLILQKELSVDLEGFKWQSERRNLQKQKVNISNFFFLP